MLRNLALARAGPKPFRSGLSKCFFERGPGWVFNVEKNELCRERLSGFNASALVRAAQDERARRIAVSAGTCGPVWFEEAPVNVRVHAVKCGSKGAPKDVGFLAGRKLKAISCFENGADGQDQEIHCENYLRRVTGLR